MPRDSKNGYYELGELISWKCSSCKNYKPLDEFHVCRANKTSGRQRRCKSCMRVTNREYMRTRRAEDSNTKLIRVKLTDGQYARLSAIGYEYEETPARVAQSIVVNYLASDQPARLCLRVALQ